MFLLLIKANAIQIVQNEMTQKMQRMENQIQNSTKLIDTMQKEIKDLTRIIKTIETNPWPLGSYCILHSGPCPPGFSWSLEMVFTWKQ